MLFSNESLYWKKQRWLRGHESRPETVPMSMLRHSRGTSTATRRHIVHTSSAPCMISQGPSLRKTVNRMSWGSAAQSLASLGADEGEGGSRRREDGIAAVCEIFGRRKRWCALWRTISLPPAVFIDAWAACIDAQVQKTKGPVVEFNRPTSSILLHIKICGSSIIINAQMHSNSFIAGVLIYVRASTTSQLSLAYRQDISACVWLISRTFSANE